MSATQNPIEAFIDRTLSAEEQAIVAAAEKKEADYHAMIAELRSRLNASVEANDTRQAARIAYEILQHEPSDEEVDSLHGFLLQRIGVPHKEPVLATMIHPNVTTISAISLLLPATLLAINQLATDHDPTRMGVWSCLWLAIVLALPLIDAGVAAAFNHFNRWRIISE